MEPVGKILRGAVAWAVLVPVCFAAPLDEIRGKLRTGEYETAIKLAAEGIDQRQFGEDWYLIKAEAEFALGKYAAAWDTVQAGLGRYQWSIQLRGAGIPAARHAGDNQRALTLLAEIQDLAGRSGWRYTDSDNLIALGRAALIAGADARQVLETFYDRVLQQFPTHRDALLASGELALVKHDAQLAAELFTLAARHHPDDAEVQFGLCRALAEADSDAAQIAWQAALKANPHHVPAMLFRVQNLIDQERYDQVESLLEKIAETNSAHPLAAAYRSVLATLKNDPKGADLQRGSALSSWKTNPEVDHVIGKMLSRKYRFAEGAAAQERALNFDPKYLPAKLQLAQDWLRLGREDDGWRMAANAHAADGYDVQTFNLLQLRDALAKFTTLESEPFQVRMEAREAKVYGQDVLEMLQRAKAALGEKYGWEPASPIIVEIFPHPNDFAVRTFGMPGVSGYLGVCFGTVITANSPASQKERPANWQSVLWHEYCHVVTLELTRHRIPRWLSEGISVYEERQADAAWGQRMNPDSRARILKGRLTPIGELSGAFLQPESPRDLNFAYFQSSLVVEFVVEQYGFPTLQKILVDLAAGVEVREALSRNASDLDQLDAEFRAWATEQAKQLGYGLDWEEYDLSAIIDDDDPDRLAGWVKDHPTSLSGLLALAKQSIESHQWDRAVEPLQTLINLYPEQTGPDSAYVLLAAVHRQRNQAEAERKMLEEYVPRDDAPATELFRLMELQQAAEDWPALSASAARLRAVQPLSPVVQRAQAVAAEHLGHWSEALPALTALVELAPDDPADLHYRLARANHALNLPRAKWHVLRSLEIAPRYRAAQELLLELVDRSISLTNFQFHHSIRSRLPFRGSSSTAFMPRSFRYPFVIVILAAVGITTLWAQNRFVRPSPAASQIPPTDRRGVPTWEVDEEFADDVFTFVRVKYTSIGSWDRWQTDWPDSDLNYPFRLQQLTSLKVDPNGRILELTDPEIFQFPFLYMIEPGNLMFHEEEIVALRRYLYNGGFLMVDDFWGEAEWDNFYREIKRVFPDREPLELPLDHPIFHCVYDLKEKPQIPSYEAAQWGRAEGITWERHDAKEVHYKGIFDDKNRMMVIVCHNTDLGDGWEREAQDPWYFQEFSEKKAYPLGINIVFYAMTH